jgi:hypothetical protein
MWTHTAREDNLLVEDKLLCPGCPILTINLSGPRRSSTIHALLGAWDTILTLQLILFSTFLAESYSYIMLKNMTLIVNFKVRHWLQPALPVDEYVDVSDCVQICSRRCGRDVSSY